jgi:hypothetical protein
MAIDSARLSDDLFPILSFLALFALSMTAGVIGPPALDTHVLHRNFTRPSGVDRLHYESAVFTPLNRFVSISLFFANKSSGSGSSNSTLEYHMTVVHSDAQSPPRRIEERRSLDSWKPLVLQLFHEFIELDFFIDLSCRFEGVYSGFESLDIQTVTGVPNHTFFERFLRILFALFCAAFFGALLVRLIQTPLAQWLPEQKLTLLLLFLEFLDNVPVYGARFYHPSAHRRQFTSVLAQGTESFAVFFALYLFGKFSYRHADPTRRFFVTRALFSAAFWAVGVAADVTPDLPYVATTRLVAIGAASVWLIALVAIAWREMDPVESYKFWLYGCASLWGAAGAVLSFRGLAPPELQFSLRLGAFNGFALVMAYWHWPYEAPAEQPYAGREEESDGDLE